MTFLAIALGISLVGAVGLIHHNALYHLGRLTPDPNIGSTRAIHLTFVGLLFLHVAEILVFAVANRLLLGWDRMGGPIKGTLDWAEVIYLTGVNFTTLGYAKIELSGPIRMVTMLQSLGGFMLLTWSATYLFTVCQKSWQEAEKN